MKRTLRVFGFLLLLPAIACAPMPTVALDATPADLEILVCFAHVAAAVFVAPGGPQFLRSIA